MQHQEVADELVRPDARELIDSTQSAHLAYTGRDGTPRVVLVGFFWTGEQFVVSTADTAPKVAALRARPTVALSIEGDRSGQARALSVRGRVDIDIIDGVVPEYLAASRRSLDPEAAREFEKNVRAMYDRMARIAITPTWARFWDFDGGRLPGFLQELADRNGS